MAVKTVDAFGKEEQDRTTGWTAQTVVVAAECSDGVLRIPLADPATGALPVAVVSGGGGDATAAKQDSQIALETAMGASLSAIDTKVATAAKQDALAALIGEVQATPTSNTLLARLKDILTNVSLAAGTNVVGKTGYKLVKVSANFTRPSDTTAYTTGDAVTNSTSAPVVFQLDLGALGAVNGQGIEIRRLSVVSSVKQSTLPLFNVFLSATTFTATNDNAALDIDDTTQQANGAWFNCDVQNFTASNSRVEYLANPQAMVLAAADTKLYGTIQAANAYTPVSGEVFYILAWVALL